MKKAILVVIVVLVGIVGSLVPTASAQVSQHALAKTAHAVLKVAEVPATPVIHPQRTVKEVLGSVVFASEEVVDVVHLGLNGLDKSFSALDQSNEYFGVLYKVVDRADELATRADSGLESAERYFFGSSN